MVKKRIHLFFIRIFFLKNKSQIKKRKGKNIQFKRENLSENHEEIIAAVEKIYRFSRAETLFFENNFFLDTLDDLNKKIAMYQCEQNWLEASPIKILQRKN